jgi:hypothetical protein
VIAWQARGQARLVEGDLTAARNLLARAGGFQAGRLEQRLDLIGKPFPLYERDLVLISRTAVRAGQAVSLSFEDCPDLAPTALLDGKRMALTLDRTERGDGFVARAVIPRKTVPGRYQLSAGCDVEAFGNTEIQVLDPASPEAATSRNAFGVRTGSDLAVWAGALVGVALLVASIGINWRGRS